MHQKSIFLPKASKAFRQQAYLLACLLLLVVPDTSLSNYIPGGPKIRFLVIPFLWAGCFMWPRKSRLGLLPKIGLYGVIPMFVVGVISSLLCDVKILGLIKTFLYMGIILPLLFSEWVADCFRQAERIGPFILGLLLLSISGPFIFRNPNQVGLATLFILPYMLNLYSLRRPYMRLLEVSNLFYLGSFILILLILVMSSSRGSLIGAIALFLSFVVLRKSQSISSISSKLFLIISCGLLGGVFFGLKENEAVTNFVYKGSENLVDDTRRLMFDESLDSFLKKPVFGYGFGLSYRVTVADQEKAFQTGRLSQTVGEFGNSTIAILCGGGIALFLTFVGLIGVAVINGIGRLMRLPFEHPYRLIICTSVSGVIGLGVQAQAEGWMLSYTWPTFVFWMLMGHLNNYGGFRLFRRSPCRSRRS